MGFGKDGKGAIVLESRAQTLGTIAGAAALLIGTKLATTEDFRILKSEVFAAITGATAGELVGLLIGIADGDLTTTEIEEAIELNGPLDRHATIESERSMRFVKLFGAVVRESAGSELVFVAEGGAAMMEVKPRWTFGLGKSWNWFVYNLAAAPTTGASVQLRAKSFGVWVE